MLWTVGLVSITSGICSFVLFSYAHKLSLLKYFLPGRPEYHFAKETLMMFSTPAERLKASLRIATVLMVALFCCHLAASSAFAQAQANAADLRGVVRDSTGAVVTNATVTA